MRNSIASSFSVRGLVCLLPCVSLAGAGLVVVACTEDPAFGVATFGSSDPGVDPTTRGSTSEDGDSTTDGMTTGRVDDTGDGETTTGMSTTTGPDDDSTGDPLDPCRQLDEPDVNGLDENGDGIDGLAGCSVFVHATLGSDLNSGLSQEDPVATVARGMGISMTFTPPRPVLVAEGTYAENVTLVSGVSLYGGYDEETWSRDVALDETVIAGSDASTVVAVDLTEAVELDGLTIRGASFDDDGQSTYAVWVKDTPEGLLRLDYCRIEAGAAGAGEDGTDGMDGEDSGPGINGLGPSSGGGGMSGCGASGGNGGDASNCPTEAGIDGSAGGDPTTVGQGGAAGASHCGGCDDAGANGSTGTPGSVGVNGLGAETTVDAAGAFGGDGLWSPLTGMDATRGHNGGGGGGGGAGGFDEDPWICDFHTGEAVPGAGGGGGGGGCGGEPGSNGTSGGAAFCVAVLSSSIEISSSTLVLGMGGQGGSGGSGGAGGLPGTAGAGALASGSGAEPGDGGAGGAGGGGGGGGGGAGGCGGPAIGIATVASSVATSDVAFIGGLAGEPGLGGAGGIRADGLGLSAPTGDEGCAGIVADLRDYP